MSSTFKRSTTDDFNGMLALMPKKQTNGSGNTEALCISRFASNLDFDNDAIINGLQLNQHLTQIYSTRGETESSSTEKILMWSPDDSRPEFVGNLGTYDRLCWAGKFENLGGTDGVVFKHANINSINTDGFMFVPIPYHDFTPEQASSMRARAYPDLNINNINGYVPAESIRIKLRFNNLQPRTFVPLFGYVTSWGQRPTEVNNAMGKMYAQRSYGWMWVSGGWRNVKSWGPSAWHAQYYNFPGGISSGTNNIYGYGVSADSTYGQGWTGHPYQVGVDPFTTRATLQEIGGNLPHNTNTTNQVYIDNDWMMYRSETVRHTAIYFLYAYDESGKGMIISCTGEMDEYEAMQNASAKVFSYKPSNAYFGQSDKNGYLDFVAPYEITSFLSDGTKDLTDLWERYDPNVYSMPGGSLNDWTKETPYRMIYRHWGDILDPYIEGAGNNSNGWYWQYYGWIGDDFSLDLARQRRFTQMMTLGNGLYGRMRAEYSGDYLPLASINLPNFSPQTNNNVDVYRSGHSPAIYNCFVRQNLQIVAYGDVTSNNINLSNWEELLINVNTDFRYSQNSTGWHWGISGYGITRNSWNYSNADIQNNSVELYSTDPDNSSDFPEGGTTPYNSHPIVKLYTGKILDFVFRDVPGQQYSDVNKYYMTGGSVSNANYIFSPTHGLNTSNTDIALSESGQGPSCLILRASWRAQCEIHSFSYAAYHNSFINEPIGGTGKLRFYERSGDSTEYLFSKTGYSYNPLNTASSNPSSFTDPNNSVSDPLFLLDDDATTRASITKAGVDNAIYIALNDAGSLFTDTGNESTYEISSFSIFIRGITLSALNYHDLKFAIVDANNSSAQTLFQSVETDTFSNKHISSVPINNVASFPSDGSAYAVTFSLAQTSVYKYSDIQNAYLKIWADQRT
jgi:hypothetical protein